MVDFLNKLLRAGEGRLLRRLELVAEETTAWEPTIEELDDEALRGKTEEFRARYLRIVGETARPYLWPVQRERLTILPSTLGELSQAIGAALVALYQRKDSASTAG